MRYLYIAVDLGLDSTGSIKPAGMAQFGRCTARVLASVPAIQQLTIWSLSDDLPSAPHIHRTVSVHAHQQLQIEVKTYANDKRRMAMDLLQAILIRRYDQVMYQMVNQALLANIPFHPPYTIWEVGIEVFEPLSRLKQRAFTYAKQVLSISLSTDEKARQSNPMLPVADVVHLCVEPPLYALPEAEDAALIIPYIPAQRRPVVLILGNMNRAHLYKGHQELILGWQEVLQAVPDAELWIGGGRGDGKADLEALVAQQPDAVASKIVFLGHLTESQVDECFRQCRVFAMPSRGEGFGLVFVEAARYGLPSIGGKYDSVKEIVLDNETGLLIEQTPQAVARACITLLTDSALAKQLGDAARQRYRQYFQFEHFRERLTKVLDLQNR